eukprot:3574385-Prymnesium_polylepis.1
MSSLGMATGTALGNCVVSAAGGYDELGAYVTVMHVCAGLAAAGFSFSVYLWQLQRTGYPNPWKAPRDAVAPGPAVPAQ